MTVDKQMSKYIHLSKYSRWLEEDKRRETWDETVDRLSSFWYEKTKNVPTDEQALTLDDVFRSVRNLEVMPSMRSLMTAGPALDRDNAAGFNCAGIAVNHPRVFDEIFYLLMCGK